MTVHTVLNDTPYLDDLAYARQLGRLCWESGVQLNFSGVAEVTPAFAETLLRTVLVERDTAVLLAALDTDTMSEAVQQTFMPVLGQALSGALPAAEPGPGAAEEEVDGEETAVSPAAFNPFLGLNQIQERYRQYVHTFQRFQNPAIQEWVEERVAHGTLLWRDPHIQLAHRFEEGDSFADLAAAALLHPETPRYFTQEAGDPEAPPLHPYRHQSEAIRAIQEGHNTIVATGTGSGKSFCFGIPIVSEALRLRDQGVAGIKAVIVYPMNALANSQYDDFARRLQGSGLRLALYTGDTFTNPEQALQEFRQRTGREHPYDSEVISREEIRDNPPDILMTNYVMLELLLTRFEDRILFPPAQRGVLRFLVLDEVHTFTGQRGADVACLIRRLKQHTGVAGQLRAIATSATVQSGEGEDAEALIADFAARLFGETFSAEHVIGETYRPPYGRGDEDLAPEVTVTEAQIEAFDGTLETAVPLAEALLGRELAAAEETAEGLGEALARQATFYFLEQVLHQGTLNLPEMADAYREAYRPEASRQEALRELEAALLVGTAPMAPQEGATAVPGRLAPRLVPKLHAFFSQGRGITTCLTQEGPHLNDRGELRCPECATHYERERPTFPLHFCRACGQEYYGVAVQADESLAPRDLGAFEYEGEAAYIYPGVYDRAQAPLPSNWLTATGNVRKKYRTAVPQNVTYCPVCNRLDPGCGHAGQMEVTLIHEPFLLCPNCSIVYDRRPSEFNKLFTYGTVGRSTATDVLVSNTLAALPRGQRKVIAFSDNRQDTALQAAHMNNLHGRFRFRRAVYHTLRRAGRPLTVEELGLPIYKTLERANALPPFQEERGAYRRGRGNERQFQQYLSFALLQDLERTHRRVHQNLEDVGLLQVIYEGLDRLAADDALWADVPVLADLNEDVRYDYLYGFLEIMRRRLALHHGAMLHFRDFQVRVLDKLNEDALFEEIDRIRPVGFSDEADTSTYRARVARFVHPSTSIVAWTRRALGVDYGDAEALIPRLVQTLARPRVAFLKREHVRYVGDLYMLPHDLPLLHAVEETRHQVCPRCGAVHHFRQLNVCTEISCGELWEMDLGDNYFRHEYTRSLTEAVPIQAAEHSGQVDGQKRRETEERFRSGDGEEGDPNVIVCTPTMELGIDIGDLSTVYMRNVPPSPSNYAQRAGRSGRKGQASLITVFCGVGSYRGPHDQYFYRYPEKIIAGKISPPRFLLDNKQLIRAHIHALVLETLSHRGDGFAGIKLPAQPQDLLNVEATGYLFYPDRRQQLEATVAGRATTVETAVRAAFAAEIEAFSWFDEAFIQGTIGNFVNTLDRAFDDWRHQYAALTAEREEIHRTLERDASNRSLEYRYSTINRKLEQMRQGKKDFYVYRYLGRQGFLPNYAFPRRAVKLSFYDTEDELSRDPVLALWEYAPGNFVYYRGSRHEIVYGRPPTHAEEGLDFTPLLVCPHCQTAYMGHDEVNRAACAACEEPLRGVYPRQRMLQMPDMVAQRRRSITADEEERRRKGYLIETYYEMGPEIEQYEVQVDGRPAFTLTYEHNGGVLLVNRGTRQAEEADEPLGFAYCTACNRWLLGETAISKHAGEEGRCPRHATLEDVLPGIELYTEAQSDVVTLDVPLPDDVVDADGFYTTLLHTFQQALAISMNLDESEVNGFLAPAPDAPEQHRVVLYETMEGGTGALASLKQPARLTAVIRSARELLHEGEAEGCEKACYECLCTFYNQREHELLDRHLALPLLASLEDITVIPADDGTDGPALEALAAQCESELERRVLRAIAERGLPLPDAAQRTIYVADEPVAIADFFYEPNHVVFVDGSPHHQDYVQAADKRKRRALRGQGYRVLVITPSTMEDGLDKLARRLGV